jgi:hypothetical protein
MPVVASLAWKGSHPCELKTRLTPPTQARLRGDVDLDDRGRVGEPKPDAQGGAHRDAVAGEVHARVGDHRCVLPDDDDAVRLGNSPHNAVGDGQGRPPLRIGQHGKITRIQVESGVWVARCRFRDLDGVTRRVKRMTPAGTTDEYGARAENALRDAIAARQPPGTGSITGTTTLGDLLTRYIERCRQDGELSPKSVDTYEATLNGVREDVDLDGRVLTV